MSMRMKGLVIALALVASTLAYGTFTKVERIWKYTGEESGIPDEIKLTPTAIPPPPPIDDYARMARFIIHYSDWCSLAHITSQQPTPGFPMGRVFSMSDGPLGFSSGTPYFYMSPFDHTVRDLYIDHRCAVSVSLAGIGYCKQISRDPEDPRCPQVILIGNYEFLKNTTAEFKTAYKYLLARHPAMKNWPNGHHFKIGKVNIVSIQVLDNIGGHKTPSVEDYYKADPVNRDNEQQLPKDFWSPLRENYEVTMA